jgi:aspartate 4-decarboxylase
MINIYELAEKNYGAAFRKYLTNDFQEIDFLLNLAKKNGVVLMDGLGFGSQPGYIRISQANLPTDDYALIGQQILACLHEYYEKFQQTLENN